MNQLARAPKQIGTVIRRARKQRGWTQSHLAERSGLRQETISLIETGEKSAKLQSILSLLAALDLEFRICERTKGHEADIEALL